MGKAFLEMLPVGVEVECRGELSIRHAQEVFRILMMMAWRGKEVRSV